MSGGRIDTVRNKEVKLFGITFLSSTSLYSKEILMWQLGLSSIFDF